VQSTLRSFDLAHLAHVELLTPKPEESLRFFTEIFSLTESGRSGQSVYLRAWDDYEHHTLKLTESKVAGIGHHAYRATSPEALRHRVGVIEKAGYGKGWTEGDLGHGPAYAFTTCDGHAMEIYYETEWYQPPPELKPALKNQAQRFPARGVNVRRLDHLNLLCSDVAELRRFMEDVLGLRTTEMIVLDSGTEAGAWVTNEKGLVPAVARLPMDTLDFSQRAAAALAGLGAAAFGGDLVAAVAEVEHLVTATREALSGPA